MENHVTSRELSERLKKLGVPQKSNFYWSIPRPEKGKNEKERLVLANNCEVMLCHKWTDWGEGFENVSAFLSSEIGGIIKNNVPFQVLLQQADIAARGNYIFDADYWATVLEYLILNGFISVDSLK